MTSPTPEAYELAFIEARRTIDRQVEELELVRTRIGTLFSVAAAVAALPAGAIIERAAQLGELGVAALLIGMGSLAVIAVTVVLVWWPTVMTTKLDAGILIGGYVETPEPATLPEIHRDLALHEARHAQANKPQLDTKYRAFVVASVAFLVEVIALFLTIVDLV